VERSAVSGTDIARECRPREGEDCRSFVELFAVASWEERQRQQHERLTGTDRDFQQRAIALSEQPPQARHLISVEAPV
jgi:hypothetical protein